MKFVQLLNLLGSLGLFLYGMKVMSDGLMDLAGERMRAFTIRLTSNRLKGVLTGLLVTGLLQSSSATTLMVVSFVHAELLSLTAAIGVVMGANIGTTFTAWIVAILGFKVKMSAIVLPLVIVGFFLSINKDRNLSGLGHFIVGFALLFIGLEFMKDAISGLENSAVLMNFFSKAGQAGLPGILLFVLMGTLLTLLLQSSSATMAITIVAASQGLLSMEAAAAIVLGENIGTTVTANLAALVAGTEARRTALAHFFFNVFGVLWMLVLFKPFLTMVDFLAGRLNGISPLTEAAGIPVGLSIFHTIFNIFNTAILLGFVGLIARLVTRIVPAKLEPELVFSTPKYLTKRMLKYPETAVNALLQETRRLYRKAVIEAVAHGIGVHRGDLRSDKSIEEVLRPTAPPAIEYGLFIDTKIRPIAREVLKFASKIQEKFELSEEDNTKVTRLKRLTRNALDIVTDVQTLTTEIGRHEHDRNSVLYREHVDLKGSVIRLVRLYLATMEDVPVEENLARLKTLRKTAEASDLDLLHRIDLLIREKEVSSSQGVSLMVCSDSVKRIFKSLSKAGEFLALFGPSYAAMKEILALKDN